MGALAKLPNIGNVLEAQLEEVGIATPEALREIGSRAAWLRILAAGSSACFHRLCALEGAVRGVRWHALDEPVKADLKEFYQAHKGL